MSADEATPEQGKDTMTQTAMTQTASTQTASTTTANPAAAGSATGERAYRKTRRGYVVSDKMDKTVVVEVEDRVKHALYGKVLRRTSKVKVHDEANAAGTGDLVLIMETRPLSATKRWRVVEILDRAK